RARHRFERDDHRQRVLVRRLASGRDRLPVGRGQRRRQERADRDGSHAVPDDARRQLHRHRDRQPLGAPDAGRPLTATIMPPNDVDPALLKALVGTSGRRKPKALVMTVLMGLSAAITGVVLVLVLAAVVSKGISIVPGGFPEWFTKNIPATVRRIGPGMK